jgi:hypothetical protein
MGAVLYSALLTGCVLAVPDPPAIGSYLYQPAYHVDDVLRGPAVPYLPQPGDIMLATDPGKFWTFTHNLALAFEPHNSAIVFRRPDGTMAILEAGPNDCLHVKTLDMLPHLKEYEDKGPVWIRKRNVPLTPEQCEKLTAFALTQDGKRFALIRLGGQLTLLRSRGPIRTFFMGKYRDHRSTYFCSELVSSACCAAGLLDPAHTRPSATYPHDLFYDHSYNLFIARNMKLYPCWDPPARWTSCPAPEAGVVAPVP